MNDKSCPTYQKKIKQLKLPKTKEEKIIYFLWLDDQLMELWADYLNMKCLYPFSDTRDEKESKQIEDKLLLIEHFEMYIDAVNLHITFQEIEQWTRDNNYKKTFIFHRI